MKPSELSGATALLSRYVGGHFLDAFQELPEELASVATEKYLGDTDDLARKKELFLDLMGDVMFAVPSVMVACGHKGESQWLDVRRTLVSHLTPPSNDRCEKY